MRSVWCAVVSVAFLSLAGGLNAQVAVQRPQGDVQDRQLSLDVVVSQRDGTAVSGLTQQDFALKDNQASAPITKFRAVAAGETPTEVILVVDAVNVNFIRLADERSRIERFLKKNESLPAPTALAIFTDDGMKIQDGFSTNGKELSDSLDAYVTGIRTTRRSSQYEAQDRFNLSMTAVKQLVAREGARPGRKLIFWVSPGWPLLSGPEMNLTGKQQEEIFNGIVGLTNEMVQTHVTMYSLNPLGVEEGVGRVFYYRDFLKGVTKPSQSELGDLGLQVLATESGGLVLTSSNDLENELKTCFADAGAYYEVSFESARGESAKEYHAIDLSVSKPGLTARTKTAYYAQP